MATLANHPTTGPVIPFSVWAVKMSLSTFATVGGGVTASMFILAATDPTTILVGALFGGGTMAAGLWKMINDHRAIGYMKATLETRAERAERLATQYQERLDAALAEAAEARVEAGILRAQVAALQTQVTTNTRAIDEQ